MDKQSAATGVADALSSEAFISGRRAGLGSLSPSLNPHPAGTAEHVQWQQGHQSGINTNADHANREARRQWRTAA